MHTVKLWLGLVLVIAASFFALGHFAQEVIRQAPPIPKQVVTAEGRQLFNNEDILEGQNVWQSIGGHELGSIWGHGSYTAPDWSADWLHRMAVWILEHWAETEHASAFARLDRATQDALRQRLQTLLRANTYNPQTRKLTLAPVVAQAFDAIGEYYAALFGDNPALDKQRQAYAMAAPTITNPENQAVLNAFFFWTAWVCVTNRPGESVSYTQNWPPDPLLGNRPSGPAVMGSIYGVATLLAALGVLGLGYGLLQRRQRFAVPDLPERDPLLGLRPTPAMRATRKYFWLVTAMLVVQVALGLVTAHYSVRGADFYGWPLSRWLPYSIARTWHLELAIFWILTALMAAGLFMAPVIGGREPRFLRGGVNILFFLVSLTVIGAMAGQWWSVTTRPGLDTNFWFGQQGWEYVDLGRFWQMAFFFAMGFWLLLMIHAVWPAFTRGTPGRHLLALFMIAAAALPVVYGIGLFWYQQTNLAKIEMLRWSVVHLWFEGFLEVLATVVIAFLFTRLGLLANSAANAAVFFTVTVFMAGAILGTFHHLYFTGTPPVILTLGATFSFLQVVPLLLLGLEGYRNLARSRARPWVRAYQWPIYCFVAVAFWNLVGAGLFGFLLNSPIVLYYTQGLGTTAVHSHTALFGVYGMLAIGLLLFCLKGMTSAKRAWDAGALAFAFWAINIGLVLSVLLSLLPIGLLQTWVSVEHGFWYARSVEFRQPELMQTLRGLRVIGDATFALGIVALAWFVAGLKAGWSLTPRRDSMPQPLPEPVPGNPEKVD